MTRTINWLKVSGTALGTSLLMAAPALAQQGPGPGPGSGQGGGSGWGPGWGYGHPMMGWGGGRYGGGWMVAHGVFHLLVLVALIAIVLACVRYLRHSCRYHHRGAGVGLEILETRYAKGEVGRDEYLEKKRDLGGRV